MNISFNNADNTNFKVRRQKFGFGSLILILIIGAVFAAAGGFAYKSMQVDKSWPRIQGEIVDVSKNISNGSTTYTPIIKYVVRGTNYQVTSSSSSSFYPTIGGKKEIAYNPSQPDQAKVIEGSGITMLILLFPAIGVLMLILGPTLFIRSVKRSQRIKSLMESGQKIQGIIVDIKSMGSNNNTAYKIVVAANDNLGTVQNYTSDSLSGTAGLAMTDFRNNPIPIDVYIDSANPQNYYVDISDIPNLTPQRIGDLIKSAVTNNQMKSVVPPKISSPVPQQPVSIKPPTPDQPTR